MRALDRDTIADFMAGVLAREESQAPPGYRRCTASPAGLPLEIFCNSDELMQSYTSRLSAEGLVPSEDRYRVYSLVWPGRAAEDIPVWVDERCSPKTFHRILAERGLRAAYPFRPNVWQFLDTRRRAGMQLVAAVTDLPPWDSGAPLRQHLHWILQSRNLRLVHASTLGANGVGVVFFGSSGAGKSGIALAGMAAGMQTVGDDYVAISAAETIRALPVFTIIKQDRTGLSHLPEMAASTAALPENWKGKVELDPRSLYPSAFVSELEIRAAVVPRITPIDTPRLNSCGHGETMRALMKSNLHQFPGETDDGMQFFGSLLRRLRVFSMELSRDFRRNAELVKGLIETL